MTVSKASDSSVYLTLNSGNFSVSDVCTVSYSQTGNYTNSDLVELNTTSGFAVTNNISVSAPTIRQVAGRCTVGNTVEASVSSTSWVGPSGTCELPTNGTRTARFNLRVEANSYAGIPRLYCDDGGGEYRVEDTYGSNGIRLATDEIVHGTPITSCQFGVSGTCVGGIRHASPSGSFPPRNVSFAAAPSGIKQLEEGFSIETQLSVGATSTCRVKDESTTAFTTYDANLLVTVVGPTSRSIGGGL
jgi:hypothetical protein